VRELAEGSTVAGRYTIVRLLGRGATKEVYLAEDKLAGSHVALALLTGAGASDPVLAARFSRECRAASVLRSPHVVRVFDVGKLADGTRYLATEAVLGRELAEAMSHGPIGPELAARFVIHVLAGLAEAHQRGIFHRDVKPENVLLAPTNEGEIAKLTDFGLAKVHDASLEGSIMLRTAQNIVVGTPEYMSPEQWQGGRIDARSDVYSTGVMLFEMLLGHCPFESKVLHAICVGHLTSPVPDFPASASSAIRALEPVVRRSLAKNPDERFQSADEMRYAVEAASGLRLDYEECVTERNLLGRFVRAELVCEAWPGAVSFIAASNVVLGRNSSAHVVVRCVPDNAENDVRSHTVSRQHAQLEWRGGRAVLNDLGSRSGTFVKGRAVTPNEPVELQNGDEIALGPHVRLAFEHAAAAAGELPRWARLVRTDDFGSGQVVVLVLTEAKISSAADASVWVPPGPAGGDMLRIRSDRTGLTVASLGAIEASPLTDGQTLRLGRLAISVALET
jgi:serine/threonine-protein kinase